MFADSTSPAIRIWDVHRKQETIVKDYTSYPIEFPFRPLLLGAPAPTQIAAAQAPILVVPLSIASIPQCEPVPASPLSVAVPCRVQHLDSLLDRTKTSIDELELARAFLNSGSPSLFLRPTDYYASFPPLQIAADKGHEAVTRQLIAACFSVDLQDKDGCTNSQVPCGIVFQRGRW